MKRDMDLVRRILTKTEESNTALNVNEFVDDEHDDISVGYHIKIMKEAGLIEGVVQGSDNNPYYYCRIDNLTWNGQEFLSNIRNDSVWEKVKVTIAKKSEDASFSVITNLASKFVSQLVLGD